MPFLLRLRFAAALLVLTCAVGASAQQLPRRSGPPIDFRHIRGQVVDAATHRPLVGAFVSLRMETGGFVRETGVGSDGRYEFEGISGTVYYVVAEMGGYHPMKVRVDLTRQVRAYVPFFLRAKKDERTNQPTSPDAMISVQTLAVPTEAQDEFKKGKKALYEDGDLNTGEQHLREAIRLYPDYSEAYVLLAACFMDQQKWVQAEETLQQSLEINDKFAPSYFVLATLRRAQGQAEEARAALERGLQSDPNSAKGHLDLAQNLLAEGKVDEAEIHARRAHELDPKRELVRVVLANILLRKGELQAAREEFEHYLDLAPDGPLASQVQAKIDEIKKRERQEVVGGLAETQAAPAIPVAAQQEFVAGKKELENGKLDAALRHLRKAIDLHPNYVQAHHVVGTVLMDQKKWVEAEQTFQHCLELNDKYAPSYLGLGTLYNIQRKPAEAAPLLKRAVELNPGSWQARFELAQSLLEEGEVAEAQTHARRAADLEPTVPMPHVLLGNIGLIRHDLPVARDEFQQFLELAPDHPLAPQLKERVAQIDAALREQQLRP